VVFPATLIIFGQVQLFIIETMHLMKSCLEGFAALIDSLSLEGYVTISWTACNLSKVMV
jgi:hypothetical protein